VWGPGAPERRRREEPGRRVAAAVQRICNRAAVQRICNRNDDRWICVCFIHRTAILKKTFITTVLTAVKKNKQPHTRPAGPGRLRSWSGPVDPEFQGRLRFSYDSMPDVHSRTTKILLNIEFKEACNELRLPADTYPGPPPIPALSAASQKAKTLQVLHHLAQTQGQRPMALPPELFSLSTC
jgi:hypothetical protein